jgi:hypothetical protein
MVNFTPRPLYSGSKYLYLVISGAGWTSESLYTGMLRRRENLLLMLGFEPGTLRPVITKTLCFFRRVHKIVKKRLLASLCLPVCLYVRQSSRNKSATIGGIFLTFDIWLFFDNLAIMYKFH